MSMPSSMADFVPCDRLLQKAYSHLQNTNQSSINPKTNSVDTDQYSLNTTTNSLNTNQNSLNATINSVNTDQYSLNTTDSLK